MEPQEDTWLEVDETGHVPGVAAELPHGHKVLLDASGNIMAIVASEAVPALEEAIAEQHDAPETRQDGQETAQSESEAIPPPLPETPALAATDAPETDVAVSAQPEDGTSAPDNVASPIAVGGTAEEETQA